MNLVSLNRDDVEFVFEGVKIFIKKIKNRPIWRRFDQRYPLFQIIEYCPVEKLKKLVKCI